MMRILTIVILALAVLYGGYWFVGRTAVQNGTDAAIERLEASGWEVDLADRETVGFPSRFDTRLTEPRLTTPGGLTWSAPFLQVYALTWQPHRIIAEWPEDQALSWEGGSADITAEGMRASAAVRPGTTLPLDRATLEASATEIALPRATLGAESLLAAIRTGSGVENGYDLYAELRGIAAPGALDGADLTFSGSTVLDAPLDRHALAAPRPRPDRLGIDRLSLQGEALDLSARGDLEIGPRGLLSGELTVESGDWRKVLTAAREAGLLTGDQAGMAEAGLSRLSPEGRVSLPLTLSEGRLSLGPIPLGTMPPLPVAQRQ